MGAWSFVTRSGSPGGAGSDAPCEHRADAKLDEEADPAGRRRAGPAYNMQHNRSAAFCVGFHPPGSIGLAFIGAGRPRPGWTGQETQRRASSRAIASTRLLTGGGRGRCSAGASYSIPGTRVDPAEHRPSRGLTTCQMGGAGRGGSSRQQDGPSAPRTYTGTELDAETAEDSPSSRTLQPSAPAARTQGAQADAYGGRDAIPAAGAVRDPISALLTRTPRAVRIRPAQYDTTTRYASWMPPTAAVELARWYQRRRPQGAGLAGATTHLRDRLGTRDSLSLPSPSLVARKPATHLHTCLTECITGSACPTRPCYPILLDSRTCNGGVSTRAVNGHWGPFAHGFTHEVAPGEFVSCT